MVAVAAVAVEGRRKCSAVARRRDCSAAEISVAKSETVIEEFVAESETVIEASAAVAVG